MHYGRLGYLIGSSTNSSLLSEFGLAQSKLVLQLYHFLLNGHIPIGGGGSNFSSKLISLYRRRGSSAVGTISMVVFKLP